MNWWQTLAAVFVSGGGAGLLGSLAGGLIRRPKTRAEAVNFLTDAAVKQVNELQEQVAEARKETVAAREETVEARRQVRLLTAEVDACMAKLRAWRAAIFEPGATVEQLRALVGTEYGSNGTSH